MKIIYSKTKALPINRINKKYGSLIVALVYVE